MVLLQARAGIQISYGQPIRVPDVQNLIMWTLADGANPQWAFLKVSLTCQDSYPSVEMHDLQVNLAIPNCAKSVGLYLEHMRACHIPFP